jgi:hypothetical protein
MLHKFRFVIAGILIVAANLAVSYGVLAARTQAQLPAGSTIYAVASSTSGTANSSGTWQDLSGLSTKVTIPTGKHGDVLVFFCGEMTTASIVMVQAKVAGSAASPGSMQLTTNPPTTAGSETRCAQFLKTGVTAGTKTVKMRWWSTSGYTSTMLNRTMYVVVNVH